MQAGLTHAIPDATLRWLAAVPAGRPVALLLRHSVRDALAPRELGYERPLNAHGERLAQALGVRLKGRLRSLHTSPLQRCVHTAEVLRESAGAAIAIVEDRFLGDPGAYVLDRELAGHNWKTMGSEGIMARMAARDEGLPGTRPPDEGAAILLRHMLDVAGETAGLHVFVTHDILLAITAARLLGAPQGEPRWPRFLEGAFFWRDAAGLNAAYREAHRSDLAEPPPLAPPAP
ncbi:MAG: histidine phosphatase family protein [Thauera phenolivorans]|uniref:Histidine phosphatase family protein n=1 Tax=Thauera phenolivorans TaxID=1792543 RepID=A0A7X7LVX8_9RHOO|nr:histidine phosphatase family protein [Thauera phenolivorans]NLF53886.1 histidine phosphatase family protein [Thauera phenolivorans]